MSAQSASEPAPVAMAAAPLPHSCQLAAAAGGVVVVCAVVCRQRGVSRVAPAGEEAGADLLSALLRCMGHCAPASVRLRVLRLRSRQRSLRLLLPVVLRLTVAVISRSAGSQKRSRRQHSCRHRREQRRGGQCFQVQPESAAAIISRQRSSSRSLSFPPLICHRLVSASHLPRPLCVSVSVCRAPV